MKCQGGKGVCQRIWYAALQANVLRSVIYKSCMVTFGCVYAYTTVILDAYLKEFFEDSNE